MKRSAAALFGIVLLTAIIMPAGVHAEDAAPSEIMTTTNATTADSSGDGLETIDTSATKVTERTAKYKKAFVSKLTAAAKKRMGEKCGASQPKIKTESDKVDGVVTARMKVYEKMQSKLTAILERAAPQQLDVADLQAASETLATKVADFKLKLTAYREALADARSIKCTDDVDGFKAALEAARKAQTDVQTAAKDIRSFVNATVKPALADVKVQLEAQATPAPTATTPTTIPATTPVTGGQQ